VDVGMMMVFASYGWDNIGDDQVWGEEHQARPSGGPIQASDVLWSAEHHFFRLFLLPRQSAADEPILAALCPNVGLGTAAVIVPWQRPARVAEQAAVLDWTCCARGGCGSDWGAGWRGASSRRFAGPWTSRASASTKPHR